MIWSWFLGSKLGRMAIAAGALIVGAFAVLMAGKRLGKAELKDKQAEDYLDRMEEGRGDVADLDTTDRDGLVDQLRKNDEQW